MKISRAEYLQWCKERALEYVEEGMVSEAFSSFASDMKKHEETADHIGLPLMARLFFGGHLNSPEKMRKFINDFN